MLKKLDFEKLLKSISERFRIMNEELNEVINETTTASDLRLKLMSMLQRRDVESFLAKIEMHLLRMFTPEFLHSNVRA